MLCIQEKIILLFSVHKTAKEALFLMTAKGLGATSVVDENGKFIGLVTDGDIRRMLARGAEFLDEPVEDLMTKKSSNNHKR